MNLGWGHTVWPMVPSQCITPGGGVHYVVSLLLMIISLDHLVKMVPATFLHYKATIFHFPLVNLAFSKLFCDIYLMVIFLFPLLLLLFPIS